MKKNIIYIGVLSIGLFFGWLIFGSSENENNPHDHSKVMQNDQMWTCAMHPQIMLPKEGDCPICGMDLIPAITSNESFNTNEFKLTKNAMALANIKTSIIGVNKAGINGTQISGKIEVNEDKTATQPAHFNGRIDKLFVNSIGEKVKKGQAIAQIYSPELVAAQQELITAYNIRETQPKLYKAVRNKFKNLKIHGNQLSEIETSGQVKTQFTIYSHVSGVVSEIIVNEGAHIMDGHPIFKVTNLSSVWVNFDVYENQISQFKIGQEVVVKTSAYPNKEFKTKISFIDPVFNKKTRTVIVRTTLDNKNNLLKPGMFVKGTVKGVALDELSELSIPSSAILWTGKRSVVYVKTDPVEPVFEMKEIILGQKSGNNYTVLKGLKNGDEIVTNGVFTVDASAQLQGKKSMMNKGKGEVEDLGYEKNQENIISDITKNERIKVSIEFQRQLKIVFNDYIKIKEALMKDDVNDVIKQAKKTLVSLSIVNINLLVNENALLKWKSLQNEIKSSLDSIKETLSIEEQRNYFKHISKHLIITIETFGITERVFTQYCPMVDNDKGAYWLSVNKEINNPYFGGSMLKCGNVEQSIE